MRRHNKPGPKSRTKTVSMDLGDTDTDNTSSFSSDFQSPERASSRILNASQSRSNISVPAARRLSPRKSATNLQSQQSTITKPTARKSTARNQSQQSTTSRSAAASNARVESSLNRRSRKRNAPTKCIQDIVRLQQTVNLLIPRLPFGRIVREIMMECSSSVDRITKEALEALQTAAEMYMVSICSDAYLLTLHRNRVTLMVKDVELVSFLRSSMNVL
ncbi:histone H3.3 type c-like [Teleopsis dalmanni]|uniref:histone H3.3 type c-like n=1 Tax=Teleopsis dalmanni TaxID=139649 RepID=UPI0018CCD372|nr:histone H3.3 type c-like [Teleopsis dalmanni]